MYLLVMIYIFKSNLKVNKGKMNFIVNYHMYKSMKQPDTKQLLLEPLSCILRLALLSYKPDGTKISILNNSIRFQDSNTMQGLFRSLQGDNREDLHNLYHPIIKSLEWYSSEDPIFNYFYTRCKLGLESLKHTYTDKTTIIHTLSHYIDIIDKKEVIEIDKEISPLIDSFKEFWTMEEIKMMYTIFTTLDSIGDDTYIKCIDDILTNKELKIFEYVKQSSSSYTD